MIAERYNKNTDEDKLTGHFFGTLRYTSFEKILKPLLVNCIRTAELADKVKKIRGGYWGDKIHFWPYDSPAEIDVLLDFDEILIGVEVKYQSGLSGDNQLEREAEILNQKANGREKILILLAPETKCREIVKKTRRRNIFNEFGVNLCSIWWEDVYDELTKLQLKDYDALIAEDLVKLLRLKGFESFRSFDVSVELDDFSKDFFTSDEEVTNLTDLTGKDYDKIIKKAFEIAADTHKHVNLFIELCKNLGEEPDINYKHWNKRNSGGFLSWFEKKVPLSWSTFYLILFFERKDNLTKNSVYVMEINLLYPRVVVARFIYPYKIDYDKLLYRKIDAPDLGLYDIYHFPINNKDDKYSLEKINGFTKVKLPKEERYNYFEASHAWFAEIPLSEINAGNIQEKIFGTFDKLAALKS